MWKVILGIGCLILAQSLAFIQVYGNLKIDYLRDNKMWIPYLIAIPCTFFFIEGSQLVYNNLSTSLSVNRFLGYSIGITVFTILSWTMFNEKLNYKDFICIFLGFCIILIQLWKKN